MTSLFFNLDRYSQISPSASIGWSQYPYTGHTPTRGASLFQTTDPSETFLIPPRCLEPSFIAGEKQLVAMPLGKDEQAALGKIFDLPFVSFLEAAVSSLNSEECRVELYLVGGTLRQLMKHHLPNFSEPEQEKRDIDFKIFISCPQQFGATIDKLIKLCVEKSFPIIYDPSQTHLPGGKKLLRFHDESGNFDCTFIPCCIDDDNAELLHWRMYASRDHFRISFSALASYRNKEFSLYNRERINPNLFLRAILQNVQQEWRFHFQDLALMLESMFLPAPGNQFITIDPNSEETADDIFIEGRRPHVNRTAISRKIQSLIKAKGISPELFYTRLKEVTETYKRWTLVGQRVLSSHIFYHLLGAAKYLCT